MTMFVRVFVPPAKTCLEHLLLSDFSQQLPLLTILAALCQTEHKILSLVEVSFKSVLLREFRMVDMKLFVTMLGKLFLSQF